MSSSETRMTALDETQGLGAERRGGHRPRRARDAGGRAVGAGGRRSDGALAGLRQGGSTPGADDGSRRVRADCRCVVRRGQRGVQRVRATRARPRHRHHRQWRSEPPGNRLRRAARSAVAGGRPVRSLGSVVHRRRLSAGGRRATTDVPAAGGGGGQGQLAATQLRRQAVAGRSSQPSHQRHRQHRAESAADDEPDAHVGAAAHRRRHRDVHDLAAARLGGAHDRAGFGVADAHHRRPRPAEVHLAMAEHRPSQRPDRRDVHGPRDRQGLRSPARSRAAIPRDERRALRGLVRRTVHVEPHAAGHDVHGERPVRHRRRRRRPARRRPARSPSATSRPSCSTRGRSRCRSRSWPR